MLEYSDFTQQELQEWLKTQGEKEFHAKQIFEWIYHKGVLSWQEMSNLSKELRDKLASKIKLPMLEKVRLTESKDGETFKFLWRLRDGQLVESVLICSGERRTVCVSSQVGCPARCAFCASGQGGFFRNLRPSEIVEQVLQTNHWLASKEERVLSCGLYGDG